MSEFDRKAAAWVRSKHPDAQPVEGSVEFHTNIAAYDSASWAEVQVSWTDARTGKEVQGTIKEDAWQWDMTEVLRELVEMPDTPTRYARVKRSRSGRPDHSEVQAYLPGNYRILHEDDYSVMIAGEDNAGWTLDGYVIPRLGSGLISAEEWSAERMREFLAGTSKPEGGWSV